MIGLRERCDEEWNCELDWGKCDREIPCDFATATTCGADYAGKYLYGGTFFISLLY